MSSSPSGGSRRRNDTSQGRPPSRVGKPPSKPEPGRRVDPTAPAGSGPSAKDYRGRRAARAAQPPRWLMILLTGCVVLLIVIVISRLGPFQAASAAPTPTPTPEVTPTPTSTPEPTPTPTPTPEPTPTPDYSQPTPLGEGADPDTWFQDALFIGDSRVDGLRLYSGIKGATFLDSVGLSVYQVMKGEAVIRKGEDKISVLDAVQQGTYDKIYIALGINEVGYFDADGFAETMSSLVDKLRELQPQATLYVQTIIPVNTAKCLEYEQRYYINNEVITTYNEALANMAAEKEVWLLSPPDDLLDENGETREDLSADGVHFQKAGYIVWLDYMLTHTGQGEPLSQTARPTVTPTAAPQATPTPAATRKPEPAPAATRQPEPTPAPPAQPEPTPAAPEQPEPTPEVPEQAEPSPAPTEQTELPPMIIEPMGVPSAPNDQEAPSPEIIEQEDSET